MCLREGRRSEEHADQLSVDVLQTAVNKWVVLVVDATPYEMRRAACVVPHRPLGRSQILTGDSAHSVRCCRRLALGAKLRAGADTTRLHTSTYGEVLHFLVEFA